MIRPLNYFLVEWDTPALTIGPETGTALTWDEVHLIAQAGFGLIWNMLGEARLIPAWIVCDMWSLYEAHAKLIRLGRASGRPCLTCFTRGQTQPMPWSTQGSDNRPKVLHQ